MSDEVLDQGLFISGDYVLVRMAMVQRVGLVGAVLLELIYHRQKLPKFADGYPATITELAEESGLSHKQVKTALDKLREQGHLVGERADEWNPTLTWRVVHTGTSREVQKGLHESDETDLTRGTKGTSLLSKNDEEPMKNKTRASARRGSNRKAQPGANSDLPDWFEELWKRWPGGGSPKKDTYERWVEHAAAVGQDSLVAAFERWVERYNLSDQRPSSLAVWLNQERYLWPDSKLPWVEPSGANGGARLTAAEQKAERQKADNQQRRVDATILDSAGVTAEALRIFREAGGTNHLLAEVLRTGTNPDQVLEKLRGGMTADAALAIVAARPTVQSILEIIQPGGHA